MGGNRRHLVEKLLLMIPRRGFTGEAAAETHVDNNCKGEVNNSLEGEESAEQGVCEMQGIVEVGLSVAMELAGDGEAEEEVGEEVARYEGVVEEEEGEVGNGQEKNTKTEIGIPEEKG